MVRLKTAIVLGSLAVLLGLAGIQLLYLSRTAPEPEKPRRYYRERVPVHPAIVSREEPVVAETLGAVEGLRLYYRNPENDPLGRGPGAAEYQKGLTAIRKNAAETLYYLEQIILDPSESALLRTALIRVVAEFHEEATRYLMAGLFADWDEDTTVRSQALHELAKFPGDETFRTMREVYELNPGFIGPNSRYLIVDAMGKSRSEEAVPFLRDRLGASEPMDIRCHAVSALGAFIERPGVFDALRAVALQDKHREVRRNALNEIGKRPGEESNGVLRRIAEDPAEDKMLRQVAQAWLDRRKGS